MTLAAVASPRRAGTASACRPAHEPNATALHLRRRAARPAPRPRSRRRYAGRRSTTPWSGPTASRIRAAAAPQVQSAGVSAHRHRRSTPAATWMHILESASHQLPSPGTLVQHEGWRAVRDIDGGLIPLSGPVRRVDGGRGGGGSVLRDRASPCIAPPTDHVRPGRSPRSAPPGRALAGSCLACRGARAPAVPDLRQRQPGMSGPEGIGAITLPPVVTSIRSTPRPSTRRAGRCRRW